MDDTTVELQKLRARLLELEAAQKWQSKEFDCYRRLFSGINDLAFICDNEGRIQFVNGVFERMTGRKPSEFMGKPFAPLFDDENLPAALENYRKTLRGESPEYELRFKGTGVLCQYRNMPLRDGHGRITGVMGIARDITRQREAEKELARKSSLLAEAQRVARMGCWEWDIKKNRITWSDELYALFGLDPAEFDPNSFEDFQKRVHPEDWKAVRDALDTVLRERQPFGVYYRSCLPDGYMRYIYSRIEMAAGPGGAPVKLIGTCQDLTERRIHEKKIEESERRFRDIFENACDGMLLADPETKMFRLANKAMRDALGYDEREIASLGLKDIHPEDEVEYNAEQFERLKRGEASIVKEVAVKRRDGSLFYADITGSRVILGGKAYMLGIFRDITELKLAAERINKYKSGLDAVFRSVKDAIITVDTGLRLVELNDAARGFCGFSRAAAGCRIDAVNCDSRCVEAVKRTVIEKRPVEVRRIMCERCSGEKSGRIVSVSTQPLLDERGGFMGAVLVIRDETRLAGLERDLGERKELHNFIGRSSALAPIFQLVEALAHTGTTVLVTGESGTGKELVAEAIHYTGDRQGEPFVKVNCAALPEQLLESELFGHVKGAFTGALRDRVGRFEMADGGTIFLDEIGDISNGMQARLLRVLQEREFERVGDSRTRKVDIRIIAATNRDLAERVRRGRFREDLYYRLKVVELALPPLRDRMEDLPLLVDHFIERFNRRLGRRITGISDETRSIFMSYRWPGNVRELEHAMEHAFILCNGPVIEAGHLPHGFHRAAAQKILKKGPVPDEREVILNALGKTAWNKARAARMLGISRRTIYRWMERLEIGGGP